MECGASAQRFKTAEAVLLQAHKRPVPTLGEFAKLGLGVPINDDHIKIKPKNITNIDKILVNLIFCLASTRVDGVLIYVFRGMRG